MRDIQIFAGDQLIWDSRLPQESGYSILGASTVEGLNKGGLLTLILPPAHPMAQSIQPMTTPVELYCNRRIRWRGRALPATEDFFRRRTIRCEGQLCFLRDSVVRPGIYEGTPSGILTQLLGIHNAAADPWKRFDVGAVTLPAEKTVRIEQINPSTVMDTLLQAVDQVGGYLIFGYPPEGPPQLGWYTAMPLQCNQPIQFSRNLLDYASSCSTDGLATRIIPYGAVLDDGSRLQINVDGNDFVADPDAVQLHGIIEKAVIYDDVTNAEELRNLAQKELYSCGRLPRQITLQAVDLSAQQTDVTAFRPGQSVVCESALHGLSGRYDLTCMETDWLNPNAGIITLIAEGAYQPDADGVLTGSVASGTQENNTAIEDASTSIQGGYKGSVATVKRDFQSRVDQTAELIRQEISKVVTTVDGVSQEINLTKSQIDLLAGELSLKITETHERIDEVNGDMQSQYESITKLIRATIDGILIGESGSDSQLRLDNDIIELLVSNVAAVVIDLRGFHADQGEFRQIHQGPFTWTVSGPHDNILTLS